MATSTKAADDHTPTGDPDHVAYGADYYWTCTCGASAAHLTDEATAHGAAEHHEQYCYDDGDVTVRVSK